MHRDVLHEILQKPTDIYYFNRDILLCTMHICVYTRIYCDKRTYTTSTKYILVYTCMYYADMCIYYYILLYTVIYGHVLLQQSIYSYILLCPIYICLYTRISYDIQTYYFNTVYTCIYSYVLCISVYIRPNRDFPWDFPWDFHWDFLKSNAQAIVYLEMYFSSKQCYRTSADIHKLGFFITLVRGCPGSQLSKGIEINEDILRYATVNTLIYASLL
jgi:hypothetical protein